jgi:hypothetical protein
MHNIVRVHYTTKGVPAMSLGIIEEKMTLEGVFKLKGVNR